MSLLNLSVLTFVNSPACAKGQQSHSPDRCGAVVTPELLWTHQFGPTVKRNSWETIFLSGTARAAPQVLHRGQGWTSSQINRAVRNRRKSKVKNRANTRNNGFGERVSIFHGERGDLRCVTRRGNPSVLHSLNEPPCFPPVPQAPH